jgi:hypothetical protein
MKMLLLLLLLLLPIPRQGREERGGVCCLLFRFDV